MLNRNNLISNKGRVIDRPELPIVVRTSESGNAIKILLITALVLAAVFFAPKLANLSFSTNDFNSRYKIEGISLDPRPSGLQTNWGVSGTIINKSNEEVPAPDLEVRLLRPDRTLVARTVVTLSEQTIPAGSAMRFKARLTTAQGEALVADVRPIRPANENSGEDSAGAPQ